MDIARRDFVAGSAMVLAATTLLRTRPAHAFSGKPGEVDPMCWIEVIAMVRRNLPDWDAAVQLEFRRPVVTRLSVRLAAPYPW